MPARAEPAVQRRRHEAGVETTRTEQPHRDRRRGSAAGRGRHARRRIRELGEPANDPPPESRSAREHEPTGSLRSVSSVPRASRARLRWTSGRRARVAPTDRASRAQASRVSGVPHAGDRACEAGTGTPDAASSTTIFRTAVGSPVRQAGADRAGIALGPAVREPCPRRRWYSPPMQVRPGGVVDDVGPAAGRADVGAEHELPAAREPAAGGPDAAGQAGGRDAGGGAARAAGGRRVGPGGGQGEAAAEAGAGEDGVAARSGRTATSRRCWASCG